MCGPRPDLENNYAGAVSWRVAKHLAKIAIQCDERPPFGPANFKQCLVRDPSQTLTGDRDGIVAGSADQIRRATAEILVEL